MVEIALKNELTPDQEQWILSNIGPRMYWFHDSRGGHGWKYKQQWLPGMVDKKWVLTLENDKQANWFVLKFL